MKLWINFNFQETSGGGNQFLQQLKDYFIEKNKYSNSIDEADVIIFNNHHNLKTIFGLLFKKKIIIHRIDGPLTFHRKFKGLIQDTLVLIFSLIFSDLVIFQSNWSKNFFIIPILIFQKKYSVIHNSSNIQKKYNIKIFKKSEKIKILFSSYSTNINKGFDIFEFIKKNNLDENVEISFVGNNPFLKNQSSLSHQEYAEILSKNDIYVFCGKYESCSNSLVEAMALNKLIFSIESGSNKEILKNHSAHFFKNKKELSNLISNAKKLISSYRNKIFENSDKRVDYHVIIQNLHNEKTKK